MRGIQVEHLCLFFLPTSAGDSESEGEEEVEKDWDNEDVESKEEVGTQAIVPTIIYILEIKLLYFDTPKDYLSREGGCARGHM